MEMRYELPYALFNCPIRFNPFQYDAYKYWQDGCKQIYIADEVGLGKTIEAGIIIKEELESDKDKKFLIIAPRFLCEQWKEQLKTLFYIDSKILNQGFKEEEHLFYKVYILPLSQLKNFPTDETTNGIFETVIIDEAHYFRNGDKSIRYQNIQRIIENINNRILLSATPINNYDTDWDNQMALFNGDNTKIIHNKKAEAFPYCKIRSIENVNCELSDIELKFYKTTEDISNLEFEKTIFKHIGASSLYALNECYKNNEFKELEWDEIQTNFEEFIDSDREEFNQGSINIPEKRLTSEYLSNGDSKARTLLDKLKEIFTNSENNKVVIFAHYLKTCEHLEDFLGTELRNEEYKIYSIMGKKSLKEQNKVAKDFKERNGKSILICSDVCKEGVNLQCANTLINYDLPFNPAILEQRIGRIDRVGQEKEINVYNFIVENTYDIAVYYTFILGKLRIVRYAVKRDLINDMDITDENNLKEMMKKAIEYKEDDVREFLIKYILSYRAEGKNKNEIKGIKAAIESKQIDDLIEEAVVIWKESWKQNNTEAFDEKLKKFYTEFELKCGIDGYIKEKLGTENKQKQSYVYTGRLLDEELIEKIKDKWKNEPKKRISLKSFIDNEEFDPYKLLEDRHDIAPVDALEIKNLDEFSYVYLDPDINIKEKKGITPWEEYVEKFVPLEIAMDYMKK